MGPYVLPIGEINALFFPPSLPMLRGAGLLLVEVTISTVAQANYLSRLDPSSTSQSIPLLGSAMFCHFAWSDAYWWWASLRRSDIGACLTASASSDGRSHRATCHEAESTLPPTSHSPENDRQQRRWTHSHAPNRAFPTLVTFPCPPVLDGARGEAHTCVSICTRYRAYAAHPIPSSRPTGGCFFFFFSADFSYGITTTPQPTAHSLLPCSLDHNLPL